jgi:hypothetical protein
MLSQILGPRTALTLVAVAPLLALAAPVMSAQDPVLGSACGQCTGSPKNPTVPPLAQGVLSIEWSGATNHGECQWGLSPAIGEFGCIQTRGCGKSLTVTILSVDSGWWYELLTAETGGGSNPPEDLDPGGSWDFFGDYVPEPTDDGSAKVFSGRVTAGCAKSGHFAINALLDTTTENVVYATITLWCSACESL